MAATYNAALVSPLLLSPFLLLPMAVFTEVSLDAANALVERLGLGSVTALRGIASGIENTNYFVTTDRDVQWVLTLFERLTFEQLPFYLHLM